MSETMSFRDFYWPRLPDQVEIKASRRVHALEQPYDGEVLQELGRKGREILGKGIFLGENARVVFNHLAELLQNPKGILSAPGLSAPIEAIFEELKLEGTPRPDRIAYSFHFLEILHSNSAVKPRETIIGKEGSLWVEAIRNDTTVDLLLEKNPWICRPDQLPVGKKLNLF